MTKPVLKLVDFDENINTINTIKTIETNKTIKTNKTMVDFVNKTKDTKARTPAGPRGPEVSPEGLDSCQEAEGVMESAQNSTLAEEKSQLQLAGQWIKQIDVDYVKVSVFPQPDIQGQFTDFKCQYGLKLSGQDIRNHQYSNKVTARHNDYLGYARTKWTDADTWQYPVIADVVKQQWRLGLPAFAGRSAVNTGIRKGNHRMPILAYTSLLISYDNTEDEWNCVLWHHDFHKVMSIPNWEWQQAHESWVSNYGIKKEFKNRVPPMIAFEWRNLK